MTCHGRRETTLAGLRGLFAQETPPGSRLAAFLVDGGSGDGTADAVAREFPEVRVLRRGPDVWWASGMRIAWKAAAAERDWDAYLWLNDDVRLDGGALLRLVAACDGRRVVTGLLRQPGTGLVAYGSDGWAWREASEVPRDEPFDAPGFLHGNCVMVPRAVFRAVGGIAPGFVHNHADMEFGERARRGGFAVAGVGPVGECGRREPYDLGLMRGMTLRGRWRTMRDPAKFAAADWLRFKLRARGAAAAAASAAKMAALLAGLGPRPRSAPYAAERGYATIRRGGSASD